MNYIVTDRHGYLKQGLIFVSINTLTHQLKDSDLFRGFQTISTWLKDGWIVEQQNPEFTKSDVIDFAEYWVNTNWVSIEECFESWKIDRKPSA